KPDITSINNKIKNKKIQLLCLENTHNYYGGICLSENELLEINYLAKKHDIPTNLDGARIFNTSTFFNVDVSMLCQHTDTMSFCLSKGLGAPVGSLLCGSKQQIAKVRELRKYLGGTMRQAGIIAAAGITALKQSNINQLKVDHQHAKTLAYELSKN